MVHHPAVIVMIALIVARVVPKVRTVMMIQVQVVIATMTTMMKVAAMMIVQVKRRGR